MDTLNDTLDRPRSDRAKTEAGGVIAVTAPVASGGLDRPRYLPWLLGITVVYLLFEMAFNARLVDVSGSLVTEEEVTRVERWGRVISGFAVTLIAWGAILKAAHRKRWAPSLAALLLAISAIFLVSVTFVAEKAWLDHRVAVSSPEQRREAYLATLLSRAVLRHSVELSGMDVSNADLTSPEGRSFIALMPTMAAAHDSLIGKVEAKAPEVVHFAIAREISLTETQAYNRILVPADADLRQTYNEVYLAAGGKRRVGLDKVKDQASKFLQDYESLLRAKGLRTAQARRDNAGRIRAEVRTRGVDVPDTWDPNDTETLRRLIVTNGRRSVEEAFAAGVKQRFGAAVQADLEWADFARHPTVLERWRAAIVASAERQGLPAEFARRFARDLVPDMSFDAFAAKVFRPLVEDAIEQRLAPLRVPVLAFADGQPHAAAGENALRALLVPPTALFFSLFGLIWHGTKIGYFVLWLKTGHARVRRHVGVSFAALAIVCLCGFFADNRITRLPIYPKLLSGVAEGNGVVGPAEALALDWVVRSQGVVWPVTEWVRRNLYFGMTFGYHPEQREYLR